MSVTDNCLSFYFVNSFNCGGFVKDLYCYLFLVCFLGNLYSPAIMVVQYGQKETK